MVEDRAAERAAVEAGYASLSEYVEQWGHEVVSDTQKRYADDVTVQELVRLRVENERLRAELLQIKQQSMETHTRTTAHQALHQNEARILATNTYEAEGRN